MWWCGSERNLKITRPGDLELAEFYLAQERRSGEGREDGDWVTLRVVTRREACFTMTRAGIGYDLHRLAAGRKLILGGIELPF